MISLGAKALRYEDFGYFEPLALSLLLIVVCWAPFTSLQNDVFLLLTKSAKRTF